MQYFAMMRKDIFIWLTLCLIYLYLTDVLCLESKSSCSNNTLTLECPDNQRIGIKRVFYGAKKDRNCSTSGRSYSENCCTRGYGDCLVYNNDIQITINSKCSGKASCQVPTPSVSTGNFCSDKTMITTDYMSVLYECVPDSMIIGLCSNEERKGKIVYLSNDDYPVPIKGKNNCTCTATTNSEYGIVVSIIDVLFPSSGRTCTQKMKIKDTSTVRGTDIGCGWPVYGFRNLYSSRSPNVTFNLITGEGDNNGYIWMELKPRLQNNEITVRCGDIKKQTTMEPTTKPSTTTTTETTKASTTTVTMTSSSTTTMAPTTTKADTMAPTTTTSTTLASTTTTAATMATNKTTASTMAPTTKQSTPQTTNASPSTKMTTKTMVTEQSTTKQTRTTDVTKPITSQTTSSNQTTKTTAATGDSAGKRGEQAVTTAKTSGGEMTTTDKGDEETAKQQMDECLIDYCYEISRPMSLIMVGSFPNTTFLNSVCKPLESSSSCLNSIRDPCENSQQMVKFKQLEEDVEVLEQLRTIVCSDHRSDLDAFEDCYTKKAKSNIAVCQSLSKPPMQSDGQPKMETEADQCMRLQKLYKCIVDATKMCGEAESKAAETITKKIQKVISGQNTMECPTSAATSFLCDNSWIFIAALMYIFLRL